MSNDLPVIHVRRKPQLMDKQFPIEILLNGRPAGRIAPGETRQFSLPSPEARLSARIWNNTSPDLPISAEGQLHYQVETRFTDGIFIAGTILVILSIILVLYTNAPVYMLIAAPPALYHVYLRFWRKDRYLWLRPLPTDKGAAAASHGPQE